MYIVSVVIDSDDDDDDDDDYSVISIAVQCDEI